MRAARSPRMASDRRGSLARTTTTVIAMVLGAGVLGACSDGPAEESGTDAAVEQDQLRDAREQWRDAGGETYSYVLEMACQVCSSEPVAIAVEDGELVSPLPDAYVDEDGVTAPGLFDDVERHLGQLEPGGYVDVSYDAETGLPESFDADPKPNTVDEEQRFTVTEIDIGSD